MYDICCYVCININFYYLLHCFYSVSHLSLFYFNFITVLCFAKKVFTYSTYVIDSIFY